MRCSLFSAVLLLTASVQGQQASYTFFGSTCRSKLLVQGFPRIGQTFSVSFGSSMCTRPTGSCWKILVTGASHAVWMGQRLPIRLPPMFSGCQLLVSPDVMVGADRGVTFSIPSNVSLLGASFYQQGFTFWCAAFGAGCVDETAATDGGHGVIGL